MPQPTSQRTVSHQHPATLEHNIKGRLSSNLVEGLFGHQLDISCQMDERHSPNAYFQRIL